MRRPSTRMALLAGRAQLALARQGRELLEEKRDALLRELYREVQVVWAAREELESAVSGARFALDAARVWLGPDQVAAAAVAAAGEIPVDVQAASIMGVALPAVAPRDVVRSAAARDRSPLASGPTLELAAERFEEVLTIAIRLATIEVRVRRLAAEIRRTSSRVNALRTRVIPELEAQSRAIELALEQRERDDRFRLKRVKRMRARRRGTGRSALAARPPRSDDGR